MNSTKIRFVYYWYWSYYYINTDIDNTGITDISTCNKSASLFLLFRRMRRSQSLIFQMSTHKSSQTGGTYKLRHFAGQTIWPKSIGGQTWSTLGYSEDRPQDILVIKMKLGIDNAVGHRGRVTRKLIWKWDFGTAAVGRGRPCEKSAAGSDSSAESAQHWACSERV